MVAIKDIAEYCGVSVATVSHVLNKTRYVCPETVEKVQAAVAALGYEPVRKTHARKTARGCIMGFFVARNFLRGSGSRNFLQVCEPPNHWVTITCNGETDEKTLLDLIKRFHIELALIHPSVQLRFARNEHIHMPIPILLFNQFPPSSFPGLDIRMNYTGAVSMALEHLLNSGHFHIMIITSHMNKEVRKSMGYTAECSYARRRSNAPDRMVIDIAETDEEQTYDMIDEATALIPVGAAASVFALNYIYKAGIRIPQQKAIVYIDDDDSVSEYMPKGSIVKLDIMDVKPLIDRVLAGEKSNQLFRLRPRFTVGDTSHCLAHDMLGQRAHGANRLMLTISEQNLVRRQNYSISVVINNSSTLFGRVLKQGIEEICWSMNIRIASLHNAEGDYMRHAEYLHTFLQERTDAVISVANNHEKVVRQLTEIYQNNKKLILGVDMPISLPDYSYTACIATNDCEKGRLAAYLLAEEMKKKNLTEVALLYSSESFFSTEQRSMTILSSLRTDYPFLHVLAQEKYTEERTGLDCVKRVISESPEVQGMCILDANVAVLAVNYLARIGRQDVLVVTAQNTVNACLAMRKYQNFLGFASSKPYEMGRDIGLAIAGALMGREIPRYVTEDPILINRENLDTAWEQVAHSKMPGAEEPEEE